MNKKIQIMNLERRYEQGNKAYDILYQQREDISKKGINSSNIIYFKLLEAIRQTTSNMIYDDYLKLKKLKKELENENLFKKS